MKKINEFEKRAQAVADKLRGFLIAVNTGGIGVVFAVAANLIEHKVSPSWGFIPAMLFLLGLGMVGFSLLLAKHREVKRSKAFESKEPEPDFSAFYWRSQTWDTVSLLLFLSGSIVGLVKLACISTAL